MLIDCGDVVVHLFRPEVRDFYAIEKMWGLEPPALPAGSVAQPVSFEQADETDDDDEP